MIHSPCIGVCTLVDDVCVGCYRTKEQIGDWLHYTNEESQVQVKELINNSKVVCSNCWLKLDNDLIEFDTF